MPLAPLHAPHRRLRGTDRHRHAETPPARPVEVGPRHVRRHAQQGVRLQPRVRSQARGRPTREPARPHGVLPVAPSETFATGKSTCRHGRRHPRLRSRRVSTHASARRVAPQRRTQNRVAHLVTSRRRRRFHLPSPPRNRPVRPPRPHAPIPSRASTPYVISATTHLDPVSPLPARGSSSVERPPGEPRHRSPESRKMES